MASSCRSFFVFQSPNQNKGHEPRVAGRFNIGYLGGGNSNIFYYHPYLGKISNLTNIFQMG